MNVRRPYVVRSLYATAFIAAVLVFAGPRMYTKRAYARINARYLALREYMFALDGYASDHAQYPAVGSCDELRRLLQTSYKRGLPPCVEDDGGVMRYAWIPYTPPCDAGVEDCAAMRPIAGHYVLVSPGADRRTGAETAELLAAAGSAPSVADQIASRIYERNRVTSWDTEIDGDLIVVSGEIINSRSVSSAHGRPAPTSRIERPFLIEFGTLAAIAIGASEWLRRIDS